MKKGFCTVLALILAVQMVWPVYGAQGKYAPSGAGWQAAQPIALNQYTSIGTASGQESWFMFSVPARGALATSLYFRSALDLTTYSGAVTMALYFATGGGYDPAPIEQKRVRYDALEMTKDGQTGREYLCAAGVDIGLPAGSYYLQVSISGNIPQGHPAELRPEYKAGQHYEAERNDTPETANPVTIGTGITGTNHAMQNADWFRFVLDKAGSISLVCSGDAHWNNDRYATGKWQFSLHTATGAVRPVPDGAWEFASNRQSAQFQGPHLEAGAYYLCVYPPSFSLIGRGYTFQLACDYPLRDFTLSAKNLTVGKGMKKQVEVTAYEPGYTTGNTEATWKSSNPRVAGVDANGNIKGVALGSATITCTIAGIEKSCAVRVIKPKPVKKVSLNKSTAKLKKGRKLRLRAKLAPANATEQAVRWHSSKPKVATVSKDGVVKALKCGKTTITVTTVDGKKKARCTIQVR